MKVEDIVMKRMKLIVASLSVILYTCSTQCFAASSEASSQAGSEASTASGTQASTHSSSEGSTHAGTAAATHAGTAASTHASGPSIITSPRVIVVRRAHLATRHKVAHKAV